MDFQWVGEQDGQFYAPSQPKRKYQSRKKEFVGWGSSNLIEFLKSIGKETRDQISQQDVTAMIVRYINEENLHHPTKKKRVECDTRLQGLFGRKTISRLKINELLSAHYAENQEPSDEEFWSSGEDAAPVKVARPLAPKKLQKKEVETPKSSFAAVIPENIKLVYLKRSLVQELLKDLDNFECKVVGSFVRIKSDPNDYLQKLPYHLIQVTGVKKVSDSDDVLLQVPARDIQISLLSDDSFTEEECEELRQKVKDGVHEKLTIIELEEKARVLHEDITKHWISREIEMLKGRIERANEKGWRKELAQYLERSKMLQSEDEKERLLREVPKVTAEQVKFDSVLKGYLDDKIDDDALSSPEQTAQENQEITRAAMNNPTEVNSPSDDDFYDYLSSPEHCNLETVRPEPNGAALNCGSGSAEQWNSHHVEDKTDPVEKDHSREKPATIQVEQRRVDHSSNGPQMIDFSSTNLSEHWKGTEIEESKQQQGRNQISRDHHDIVDFKSGLQLDSTVKKPQMMTFSSVSSQLATSNPLAKVVTNKGIAKTTQEINFNSIEQEITRFSAASNLSPSTGLSPRTSYAGAQVQEQHKQPLQRNPSLDLAKNRQQSVEKKYTPAAPAQVHVQEQQKQPLQRNSSFRQQSLEKKCNPAPAQVQEQHKQPLQRNSSLDLAKNRQQSLEKKCNPAPAQVQEQHKQPLQGNSSLHLANNRQQSVEKKCAPAPAQVIDLISDDEEEEETIRPRTSQPTQTPIPPTQNPTHTLILNIKTPMWHYMDPQMHIQGPFPLELLKQWRDAHYFSPDFRVWRADQNPIQSVLLTDVLRHVFGW